VAFSWSFRATDRDGTRYVDVTVIISTLIQCASTHQLLYLSSPQLFHDRSRIPMAGVLDGKRRHRCLFYMLYALSSTQANRKSGFVVVSPLVKTTRKSTLENAYNARSVKLVQDEVFPIGYVKSHIVILSTRSVFTAFVTFFLQLALRLGVCQSRITFHNHAQSPTAADDALRDLQNHGFRVEGIPAVPFGGMFTIGCFREWLADRQRLEHMLHDPSNANKGAASSSTSLGKVQIHDTETRKRRADASYCRKKRFLKKIEVEGMQEEVERLRQQNGRLKEEGARLERCLRQAQKVVEDQALCTSRGHPPSAPSHGHHERAATHALLRTLAAAPCAASSGQGALHPSVPFPAPTLVGRNSSSSSESCWSDLHSSLGLATLSSALSGAPVPVQVPVQRFPSVRPTLSSVPPPSHYNEHLLRTLVGTATATTTAPATTDPLLSLALARPQPLPLHATHVDRSRLHLFHEPPEDLRQLLVQQLLRETFLPRRRGRDA
jgi:hypothetical protein